MLRYLDVLVGEARRMRVARISRGDDPRFLWQLRGFAAGIGALFLRAFERGERVYLAMVSRGLRRADARRRGGRRARATAGQWAGRRDRCRCRPWPSRRRRDRAVVLSMIGAVQDRERGLLAGRRGCVTRTRTGTSRCSGVDLHVPRGERVALLGPNGAGKTTLVLHLNGILTGGAGTVTVGGLTVDQDRATLAEIRRRVGIVFQDPDDQLFLPTVAEDVAFGPANLGLRGAELAARVDEALAAVGMTEHRDRAPHHLSFGQRRRVAVATVLAMRPEILVLDEPSSNLDPAARRELAEILRGLPVTLLMVTHDLPYAMELCDRSVILDDGRIVADAPDRRPARRRVPAGRHRLELPYGFDPRLAVRPAQCPDRRSAPAAPSR